MKNFNVLKKILITQKLWLAFFCLLLSSSTLTAQIDFEEITNAGLPAVRQGSSSFADVDDDGDIDIFVSGNISGTYIARIYLNDGNGEFTLSSNALTGVAGVSSSLFLDIDNDNDQDLIYFGSLIQTGSVTKLYVNDGNGNFTEDASANFTGLSSGDIAATDIDNDNDLDIMLTGVGASALLTELYINDGDGTFTLSQENFQDVGVSTVEFADFDNDNDSDLLLFGANQGVFYGQIYLNDGTGSFDLQDNSNVQGLVFAASTVADFNNDGFQDFVVAGRFDNNFNSASTYYQNNGDATFSVVGGTDFINVEGGSMASEDLNNDGYNDIIITGTEKIQDSNFTYETKVYLGQPDESFIEFDLPVLPKVTDSGHQLVIDLNNDSDIDVIIFGRSFSAQSFGKAFLNVPVSCNTPNNLLVNNVTTTTASLSWDAVSTENGGYDYAVITDGTTPDASTTPSGSVGTGVTNVNLTGLTEATAYDVYVRTNCGSGDLSEWSVQESFSTIDPNALTKEYFVPLADLIGATGNCDGTGNNYYGSPDIGFQWTDTLSPSANLLSVAIEYNMGVSCGTTSANPTLNNESQTSVSWNDGCFCAPTAAQQTYINHNLDQNDYNLNAVNSYVIPVDSATGFNNEPASLEGFFAKITVSYSIGCAAPINISATNITTTTADLSWVAADLENGGYDYVLITDGTTPDSSTTPSGSVGTGVTNVNLTGLTEATDYDVYIRTNCGSGELSEWSVQESFSTIDPNALTKEYFVPLADLIGATGNCDSTGNNYYGSSNIGFQWTDTLSPSANLLNVAIEYNMGVSCGNTSATPTLNSETQTSVSWNSACACAPTAAQQTYIDHDLDQNDYNLSAVNSYVIPVSDTTGFNNEPASLEGFFAKITVTYNIPVINNPDFTLASNGITCLCPDADYGDSGTLEINGVQKTFTKRSRAQLDALIAADQNDSQIALTCTSGITDMSSLFESQTLFNQDLEHWDVSNVTNMFQMFRDASSFNQNIEHWDVSSVTNMRGMFYSASSYNQPLDDWDVGNVINMSTMFYESAFNQPLNQWDVGNVTNMRFMFGFNSNFNQPLDNWNVSNVTNMEALFSNSSFNQNINNWDISNVTNLVQTFSSTPFDQPVNSWDVSNVTNMQFLFGGTPFNQPLDNWDVSNVTNMSAMFSDAHSFNQPLENWDVSNVTNMGQMFSRTDDFNQPLNNWDVSNVTQMWNMFWEASSFDQPLNDWDVSNVTTMVLMFRDAVSFNQDISSWCVEQIPTEPNLFSQNSPLQNDFKPQWGSACSVNNPDFILASNGITCLCPDADFGDSGTLTINGVDKTFTKRSRAQLDALITANQNDPQIALTCTSGITDMSNLFVFKNTFNQNLEHWDVGNVTTMFQMFGLASSFNQPLDNWNVSNVTNMDRMFLFSYDFNQPLNSWDVSNVINMNNMFGGSNNGITPTAFNQPLNNWDTGNVEIMSGMFRSSSFNQDISNWDVSSVTDMSFMFKLNYVFDQPLNSWDVSNVTNMNNMFGGSNDASAIPTAFNQPLDNWDTGNVGIMSGLFWRSSFNQDISNWNVSSVTDMSAMFFDNNEFNQPLNSWNVSNVTNMLDMFSFADIFNQPLDNWDVSSVTNMDYMFDTATSFNQNISSWCVENILTEPVFFSFNSPLQNDFKPNWGISCDISSCTIPTNLISSNITVNSADLIWEATTTESDGYDYVLITDGSTPDASTTPTDSVGTGVTTVNLTGLSSATIYDAYVRANCDAGSFSEWSVVANFTTASNLPIANAQNITVQLGANGEVSITPAMVDNGSTAEAGIVSLSLDITEFDCSDLGTNTVILTITDVNNDSDSATATVTVEDNIAPTAVVQDITVQLDANGEVNLTANDIDNGSSDNCSIVSYNLNVNMFDCDDLGDNTVTLTVTDASGNSDSTTATVTVQDALVPTVVAQNLTVQLDASGNASITPAMIDNSSTDNCGIASMTLDITEFDCSDVGANTVTLIVTDVNGNSNAGTATITVEDNILPAVVTNDITVQLDASGSASIVAADINSDSTDNCGIATMSLDFTEFDCSDVGANTVTLTVTDVNGNSNTGTATVTVEDNILPAVVTNDLTVQLDANGNASITASMIDNNSSDNCGIASLSLDVTTFTGANLGPNTVTLTVIDANGNSNSATAIVTVLAQDDDAPVANTQDITVQLDANGQVSITPAMVDNGSTAEAGIASLSLDTTDFDCSDVGINTVTLTVTDVNNDSDTATAVVTVEDSISPMVSVQDIMVQLDVDGNASISVGDIDSGSSDNCGIASSVLDVTAFDCSDVGPNSVTLTVTDVNGNSSSEIASVTVQDKIVPTVITQDVTIQLDIFGNASITPAMIDDGSFDNCNIVSISLDQMNFDSGDLGANTVTLTVEDQSGNTATGTAVVTVQEAQTATFAFQEVFTLPNAAVFGSVVFNDVDGDNDQDMVLSGAALINQFGGPNGGQISRLYTNDGMGNFSQIQSNKTQFLGLSYSSADFADINNDGTLDFISAGEDYNTGTNYVKYYANYGSYNFTEVSGIPFPNIERVDFKIADFDADGVNDILMIGLLPAGSPANARLFENQGTATNPSYANRFSSINPLPRVSNGSIDVADIDGDNDLDIFVSGQMTNGTKIARLYRNNGNFQFSQVMGTSFDHVDSGDSDFADVDDDGDQDLLISGLDSSNNNVLKLYLNDGTGVFTEVADAITIPSSFLLQAFEFADVDGDTDKDVLLSGYNPSNSNKITTLWENTLYSPSVALRGENSTRLEMDFEEEQPNFGVGFKVIPNPTNLGYTNILMPDVKGEVTVTVSDVFGRIVSTKIQTVNSNQIRINTYDFSSGVYVISLKKGKSTFTAKLIVE